MKATIFFRINMQAPNNSARNRASAFSRDWQFWPALFCPRCSRRASSAWAGVWESRAAAGTGGCGGDGRLGGSSVSGKCEVSAAGHLRMGMVEAGGEILSEKGRKWQNPPQYLTGGSLWLTETSWEEGFVIRLVGTKQKKYYGHLGCTPRLLWAWNYSSEKPFLRERSTCEWWDVGSIWTYLGAKAVELVSPEAGSQLLLWQLWGKGQTSG